MIKFGLVLLGAAVMVTGLALTSLPLVLVMVGAALIRAGQVVEA